MAEPCIRCGQCEIVCPVNLKPQFLHASSNNSDWDTVQVLNIDACLFCHACTVACPSQIPLRDQFINAAEQVKVHHEKRQASLQAKKRFEAREARLLSKKELKQKPLDEKQAAIQAALARAQWKYEDA